MFLKYLLKIKLCILLSIVALSTSAQTINHALGSIDIKGVPQRVVVLGHGSLDFLDALNISPIGVPQQLLPDFLSHYNSKEYAPTGAAKEPNFEAIYMLKPDLIIADMRQAELYKDLSQIAPVYMFQIDTSDYWKTTQHHWRTLAAIFNKQAQAETMISNIQAGIDQVSEKAEQLPSQALVVMNNGNNLAMFSEKSRFSMIFQEFNFKQASSQNNHSVTGPHGNLISFEYIADANPQVMFILDREQAIGQSNGRAKALFDNALVNATPAALSNKVVFMDPAAWYLAAGGYQATQIMIDDALSALN